MKFLDLTGKRFARLIAIKRVENAPGYGQARWLFECDCGNQVVAFGYNVVHGRQQSCGCYKKDNPARKTHGKAGTKVFHTWAAIRQRCINSNSHVFDRYGERGITVCERWESFDNFYADMGDPPSAAHTIERKNNNEGYNPDNCVWETRKRQARNREVTIRYKFDGITKPLADWAEDFGIPYSTIWHRYKIAGDRGAHLFRPLRIIKRRKP